MTTPTVPESMRGEQNGYLETIGRVSGASRVTEIWFAAEDDRIYLLSGYHNKDWIRNLTKTPRVRFRIGNRWFTGTARLVDADTDREERDRIRVALAGKYYNGDLAGGDNWATTGTPFAIDLDRETSDGSSETALPGLDNAPRTGFIETTGRRSGEARETQIGFATDGDRIYAIASKGAVNDWVKNLVRNPGVRFRIGETWHAGHAHVAEHETDIATVRQEMRSKYMGSKIGTDWIGTGLPIIITPARRSGNDTR